MFFLRFLVFVIVLWIVPKILAALFRKPLQPRKPDNDNAAATETVKDPVCGMYLDPRLAIRSGDQYFCSEECRRRYSEMAKK